MWSRVALNSVPECWNHRSEPPYMAQIQVEAGRAVERLESGVEGYVHQVCAGACTGLKRTSESQKLELQADVSHHVGGS